MRIFIREGNHFKREILWEVPGNTEKPTKTENMPTMSFKEDFNLFIGSKYGVFKALKVAVGRPTISKVIQSLQHLSKTSDVTAMAWSDEDEEEILLGMSNQIVKVYDTNYKAFNVSTDVGFSSSEGDTKGSICGLSRYDGALVTAVESGHIRLWRFERDQALQIHAGGPLSRMRHSKSNKNIIGTGGLENELKLWDLTSGNSIFTAKNVPNDSLQLRVKVWVNDLVFLPDTDKVVVGSRYGYVRMYDPKAQRRPVIKVDMPDKSVTCMATCNRDHTVLCGLAKGDIQAVDLRMGRPAEIYKGFNGAVRDIVCHPSEPYIVSVSLDRFIRIHDFTTKKLVHKEFVVSRMNSVLMRSDCSLKIPSLDHENNVVNKVPSNQVVNQEIDRVFDAMETVGDMKKRKIETSITSKTENSCKKKKKQSAFMNPFANPLTVPEDITQKEKMCEFSNENAEDREKNDNSDDDIQFLCETVNEPSDGSESESQADEAEGSSDDLDSDRENCEDSSLETDESDKNNGGAKLS